MTISGLTLSFQGESQHKENGGCPSNCKLSNKKEENTCSISNRSSMIKNSKENNTHTTGGIMFQMPLHYPRYTKEDYEAMPEWKLDQLLSQYGLLSTDHGDLANKREFAMGAFLWPDFDYEEPKSSPTHTLQDYYSAPKKNIVMIVGSFLRRTFGFA